MQEQTIEEILEDFHIEYGVSRLKISQLWDTMEYSINTLEHKLNLLTKNNK